MLKPVLQSLTVHTFIAVACTTAMALSLSVHAAEIYKVVDENGRVTYTDKPPQNQAAEKVKLKELNTVPPTVITKRPATEPEKSEIPTRYELRITHPADEFHVQPGMRHLNVQVAVDPPVHPRHRLQVLDNGQVIPGTTLENIVVRGTHVLQARVVDQGGRTISQSEPTQFYVHRPTVRNQN